MIISASRRTDIPAFYSEWFMKRINAGYFYSINPYNSKQIKAYSLAPEDVDVLVFWSKNPKPMIKYLDELNRRGYNFYFHYTLNDYPLVFEPHVGSYHARIETFKQLSNRLGSKRVIWRYDPIIISTLSPVDYHVEKFENTAILLKKYTSRVIISFVNLYSHAFTRWQQMTQTNDLALIDLTKPEYIDDLLYLIKNLKKIAHKNGLDIYTCAEELNLEPYGINMGSCIDIKLINHLFGLKLKYAKDPHQRKQCLCSQSVDMGVYNTCQHFCYYCYGYHNEKHVNTILLKHDSESPALIGDYPVDENIPIIKKEISAGKQITLFED